MRFRLGLAAVLLLASAPAVAAPPAAGDASPGGFTSSNVHWVANIPVDSPGVGARLVWVGGVPRLYVTGVTGLTIYDMSNPVLPLPLGHMPLPNWENEDVSVSADGNTVLIANDTVGDSYLIDTTDVTKPLLMSLMPATAHTITCVKADCSFAYGNYGDIFDLRDRANPKVAGDWRPMKLTQGAHDLDLDATGYLIADTVPRVMLDPRQDPLHPKLITTGDVPSSQHLAYQHNNLRPNAKAWRARTASDTSAALKPGELLLANGETNFKPQCDGSSNGPFATWSLKNWDRGAKMQPLDIFRPIHNGEYTDGDPAVNVIGCSGHWFSVRNDIVAAGWYEHGTRFLQIDPANGSITEVGYFEPLVGSTSVAHWIDDEYVVTVDYERGIDILRFDVNAARPSRPAIVQSWLAKLHAAPSPASDVARYACRLSSQRAA